MYVPYLHKHKLNTVKFYYWPNKMYPISHRYWKKVFKQIGGWLETHPVWLKTSGRGLSLGSQQRKAEGPGCWGRRGDWGRTGLEGDGSRWTQCGRWREDVWPLWTIKYFNSGFPGSQCALQIQIGLDKHGCQKCPDWFPKARQNLNRKHKFSEWVHNVSGGGVCDPGEE